LGFRPPRKQVSHIYIEPLHIVEQIVRSVVSEGIQDWLNVAADDDLLLHGQVRTECTAPGYRDTKTQRPETHTDTHRHTLLLLLGALRYYKYVYI
jgi:hypothetical protein